MGNYSTDNIIMAFTNNTTNDSRVYHVLQDRSTVEVVLCVIVLSLIITTAVLGNVAVILAVTREHELREQVSNLFILNLGITDLSSAIFIAFSSLLFIGLDWKKVHPIWCNLTCAANYLFIIVSMLTMCFISVDRYQAVIHPFQYRERITKTMIRTMIIYSWCQGLAFALAPVGLNWIHYDYWEGICAIDWNYQKKEAMYYVIIAFLLCFAFPGLGMTFCYLRIASAARKCVTPVIPEIGQIASNVSPLNKHDKVHEESGIKSNKKKKTNASSKVVKSLIIVVVLFFICMTPFCITKLLKVVSPDKDVVPPYANLSASFIGYISSVVNPLIYGIFRKEFRKAYKKLLLQFPCFEFLRSSDEHTFITPSEPSRRINTSVI